MTIRTLLAGSLLLAAVAGFPSRTLTAQAPAARPAEYDALKAIA